MRRYTWARERAAAARELLRRHPEVNIVVADDGLQHVRLARDAQLIVFDERGAGNGLLLPAGPLREPLTRAGAAPQRRRLQRARRQHRVAGWRGSPGPCWRDAAGRVVGWRGGEPGHVATLAGRPMLAVAGIARPGRFFDMLRGHGLRIDELPLPDHHPFDAPPWPEGTPDVILTEKDAVKLPPATPLGATRVWVATLDFRLDPASEAALLRLLPARPEQPKE